MPSSLRKSGKYHFKKPLGSAITQPTSLQQLLACLHPSSRFNAPFRPMGANSAATECNGSSAGTIIDMTRFNRLLEIDAYNHTVTVQAGIRLGTLARELSKQGLELAGSYELMDRTVGGAIAGGCIGPSIASDGAFFAAQVIALKIATPGGRIANIVDDHRNLLHAFRLSYGMLGVIYEAKLKVRPVREITVTHRRCNINQFAAATESLSKTDIGVKFYLMPFRDRVYLDLRRYTTEVRNTASLAGKLKDWGESTILPHIFKSISRIVPASSMRYRIIDELSMATQGVVNNHLSFSGGNSQTDNHRPGKKISMPLQYSTWLFPASDFSVVVKTYHDFCLRIKSESGFRCDLPTVGFRLPRDRSAILSPSFDEPMFALRAVSAQTAGWEDFVIDFAAFAEHWGGHAFFNQTRSLSADHAASLFHNRSACFRRIRHQLDPDDRMMNPFLSQYFL